MEIIDEQIRETLQFLEKIYSVGVMPYVIVSSDNVEIGHKWTDAKLEKLYNDGMEILKELQMKKQKQNENNSSSNF